MSNVEPGWRAAGADTIVFVGSEHRSLVAIDRATGSKKWALEAPDGIVPESLVAVGDQMLYAHGSGVTSSVGAATGRERWRTMIQDDVTEAVAGDGAVVVLGHRLHGLDAATGRPLWTADRLDDSPTPPDRRALAVHRGLVARSRPGAVEGLDPRTGAVRETWRFPAAVGVPTPRLEEIWDLGDALAARAGGHGLVVWRNERAEVVPLPGGAVADVAARVALLTGGGEFFSTTAVAFGPGQTAGSGPIPSVVAPSREPPERCDWDDSIAAIRRAHLDVALPRGPYVRHRDDLFKPAGLVFSLGLTDGVLRSIPPDGRAGRPLADGIQDTPPMAFDAGHVYAVARRANASVVLRVPRGGGAVRELFTSDHPPQAIAVNDTRIFLASRNGEILSVALREGGAPSVVARERPTSPCGETFRLEWAGDSLVWIGADHPGGEFGSLWSVRL